MNFGPPLDIQHDQEGHPCSYCTPLRDQCDNTDSCDQSDGDLLLGLHGSTHKGDMIWKYARELHLFKYFEGFISRALHGISCNHHRQGDHVLMRHFVKRRAALSILPHLAYVSIRAFCTKTSDRNPLLIIFSKDLHALLHGCQVSTSKEHNDNDFRVFLHASLQNLLNACCSEFFYSSLIDITLQSSSSYP